MEIWEARQLLDSALEHFLTNELPANRRLLIIMKQLEELGHDTFIMPQPKYRLIPNKAVKGSLERHRQKAAKTEERMRRKLGR